MSKSEACPVCRKPATAEFRPFCSRGCKDRDLLQWLGDGYRIKGPPTDEEPESQPSTPSVDED